MNFDFTLRNDGERFFSVAEMRRAARNEKIIKMFTEMRQAGTLRTIAVEHIAKKIKCSPSTIWKVVYYNNLP